MRLSDQHVKQLQKLLKEQFGLDYTVEQAQEAGLAVMGFVVAKAQRKNSITNNMEDKNEVTTT